MEYLPHMPVRYEHIPKSAYSYPYFNVFELLINKMADYIAIDWNNILPEDDPDTAALLWHQKFLGIMNKCIPTQFLTRKKRLPWLTKNVVRYIRRQNAAFNKAK